MVKKTIGFGAMAKLLGVEKASPAAPAAEQPIVPKAPEPVKPAVNRPGGVLPPKQMQSSHEKVKMDPGQTLGEATQVPRGTKVPGVSQTPDYARAALSSGRRSGSRVCCDAALVPSRCR